MTPAEHLRSLLEGFGNATPEEQTELLEESKALVKSFPLAVGLSKVSGTGVFLGIHHGVVGTKFFTRIKKARPQKEAVSRYVYQQLFESSVEAYGIKAHDNDASPSAFDDSIPVFFESGSSIAFCIGRLAQFIQRIRHTTQQTTPSILDNRYSTHSFLTNNLVGLTALAGFVEHIEPTEGRLSLEYFGFLPAFDQDPQSKADWVAEATVYDSLAKRIQKCQKAVIACSNLSLLAGPQVGTRANCITKSALASGFSLWPEDDRFEFFLCLHLDKLVPMFSDEFTHTAPMPHCNFVFPRPTVNVTTNLPTLASRKGKQLTTFHSELTGKDIARNTPVVALHEMNKERTSIPFANIPWLTWLSNDAVRRSTNILVGLPNDNDAPTDLSKHVADVNLILEHANIEFRFAISNVNTMGRSRVGHIKCE